MTINRDQAASLTAGTSNCWNPFFKHWMPYLFQRVAHPTRRHVFLPLARDYKPLGYIGSHYVKYEEVALTHGVVFQRDPAALKDVWWNTDSHGRLWLYDDSAKSRFTYFERLERLMLKANTILVLEKSHGRYPA